MVRNISLIVALLVAAISPISAALDSVPLPGGVKAVWDFEKAQREKSSTRERVCLNGLWLWQPARNDKGLATPENSVAADAPIPEGGWGYFKVPGCWPGIGDYPGHCN